MKVSSCIHSFAVLALSFSTIYSSSALSIESKAVAHLQPRLDSGSIVPGVSSSSISVRKTKQCSFTPPVSTTPLPTGGALPVANVFPPNNASTLANKLSYARSYKTKCAKKTGTISLPSSSETSALHGGTSTELPGSRNGSPGGGADTGSSGAGNSGPGGNTGTGSSTLGNDSPGGNPGAGSFGAETNVAESSVPGESPATSGGTSESTGSEYSQSPAAANDQSSNAAGSAGVCGSQQTVTVTSQTTVTVTQVAQGGASAEANAGPKVLSDNGSDASSGLNAPQTHAAPASRSTGRKRTKCAKGYASKTTGAGSSSSSSPSDLESADWSAGSGPSKSASSGSAESGSGAPGAQPSESAGSGPSELVSTGSAEPSSGASGIHPSGFGQSSSGTPINSGPYGNATSSGAVSPSGSSSPASPFPLSNSTNTTLTTKLKGQFWAGATIGTLMRMEAIPQRRFYDFDGETVKDPIKTLGDAGVNAIRVQGSRGKCLGPTHFVNNGSTLGDELTFSLDWGCLDIAVKTAQRGVAQGMRVVLTINQGFDIPEGMELFTYEQMVGEVQKEAKRQLQPFLDAGIVPDVILFENEGTDGFLFNETATGHTRGRDDGKVPKAQVDKEMCGQIPTGNTVSFPQYAGYLKAELMACNDAITAAGLPTAAVRYGLHSHGQYVQWKEGVFHGPNPTSQTELKDTSGKTCSNSVIPTDILAANASELITIMGFSAYADPMTPRDINSPSSQHDALNRTMTTLTQMLGYAEAYGKYGSGPFAGEYKLQALGVEYGTSYTYEQVPQEQQITTMLLSFLQQIPNVLGMLWYEPWYCHGDWEGGRAGLCHNIDSNGISGQAPTDTLKTWGAAALSPWKH